MNIYLVDYPNVKRSALTTIENLKAEDLVYIYYNANASRIPIDEMNRICRCDAPVNTVDMGNNYLSNPITIRIAATAGWYLGQSEENHVQIVSKRMSLNGMLDFRTAFCGDDRLEIRDRIVSMDILPEIKTKKAAELEHEEKTSEENSEL